MVRAEAPDSSRRPETVERPEAVRAGSFGAFAYPPRDPRAPRPAVVYLHGKCGVATNGCPHFRAGVEPHAWLVCPVANDPCPGGGASWAGSIVERRAVIDAAIAGLSLAHPGAVDPAAPTVLIGFSQGVWTALELVRATPGRYRGLLLIGADAEPDAASLRASGVKRVALMAGVYDAAAPAMQTAAARLAAQSMDARFVSLGTVGHTYVGESERPLRDTLAWLEDSG